MAAERGDTYSQNTLGYFFDLGIGTSKNPQKALYWYKKAAQAGDTSAYANVATVYRDIGNDKQARFWFLKALERGDGDAALELGKLYLKGRKSQGVSKAADYLRLALKSKNITEDSIEEARQLLKELKSVEPKRR